MVRKQLEESDYLCIAYGGRPDFGARSWLDGQLYLKCFLFHLEFSAHQIHQSRGQFQPHPRHVVAFCLVTIAVDQLGVNELPVSWHRTWWQLHRQPEQRRLHISL